MKVKNKSPWARFNNSDNTEKHVEKVSFDIEKNSIKDMGEGRVMFSKPVVITDNSEMWSGAQYEIPSLDITQYKGILTADHVDRLENVLGQVIGVKKVANRKVTIDGVNFAVKENPLADFAKRMVMAGHITDFSVETVGPWPDDDGMLKNHTMVGLSLVVTGNNKQAHINRLAEQTLRDAQALGLDVTSFANTFNLPIDNKKPLSDNSDMFKTVKNSRPFAVTLKFKNSQGEDTEVTLKPNQTVDVPADQEPSVTDQVEKAQEPKAEEPKPNPEPAKPESQENSLEKLFTQFSAKMDDRFEKIEKTIFDNSAAEPQFTKPGKNSPTALKDKNYMERHGDQILLAWDALKGGRPEAMKELHDINKFHLEELQKAGKAPSYDPVTKNAITISDFGNFVISPELLTDIVGFRSNFGGILSKLNFKDTLSLQMAWLERNGDINMQEVEFCDDGSDGNLKPLSEYTADIKTSNMHELAAVTPVCNAATRFLAADLLDDVAKGYRLDFDRKRAQIFVARLQQAVNQTGNVVHYNTGTGGGGANVNALQSFMQVAGMQEEIMGGTYILSNASYWELMGRQAAAGINTDSGFRIFTTGDNGPLMFGAPYVIVPNELLPKLGSNETRSFVVGGVTVTITSAVFYVDLNTFKGRTSGNLSYDLSTEAAYEENGTVKSAYQRNELVLRGSFFRGAAVLDPEMVVGLEAVNLS